LTQGLEKSPGITAVDGPTTVLTWERYIESGSDQLPTDAAAGRNWPTTWSRSPSPSPGARAYIDMKDLASVRLEIRGRGEYFGRHGSIEPFSTNLVRLPGRAPGPARRPRQAGRQRRRFGRDHDAPATDADRKLSRSRRG
jgi:hypothetical protein